jgi:putative transposase
MPGPNKANQRWSMDLVSDKLANGSRFRMLSIVVEFSRECVLQVVDFPSLAIA